MRKYGYYPYPPRRRGTGIVSKIFIIITLAAIFGPISIYLYNNGPLPELLESVYEIDVVKSAVGIVEQIKSELVPAQDTDKVKPTVNVDRNQPESKPAQDTQSVPVKPSNAPISVAELQTRMLDLINTERIKAGLDPVKLGKNTAAQSHADDMLDNCFSAHWGTDGLKPYMRYSLAGGYQYNAENVSGLSYCIKPSDNYLTIEPRGEITNVMNGLMASPGHRDNILDPHHSWVNIGLAWNDYNMMVVQHFEYDYVTFSKKPSINGGVLSFALTTKNDAVFSNNPVQVLYDPPTHRLAQGQLVNTYCYEVGMPVASIVSPPRPGSYYTDTSYLEPSYWKCPNPYDIPPDTPAPRSADGAHAAHQKALKKSQTANSAETWIVPFHVADTWDAAYNKLGVTHDLSNILARYGPGVYTVVVWGLAEGDEVILAEYSVFYDYPL